jgi:hypothetical protein
MITNMVNSLFDAKIMLDRKKLIQSISDPIKPAYRPVIQQFPIS